MGAVVTKQACTSCGVDRGVCEFSENGETCDNCATLKLCVRCDEQRPRHDFGKVTKSPDGRHSWCKPCLRAYNRARYAKNPAFYRSKNAAIRTADRTANPELYLARQREYQATYRAVNPDKIKLQKSARRAAQRGARHEPYNRSEIFARWSGLCCYCDAPAVHLDHLTALARGGDDVESNLVPACAPCNLSKNAKSLAEWALSWF